MSIYRGWKPENAYKPDAEPERTQAGPPPVHLRKAQPANVLLPRTRAWIESLPEPARPHTLTTRYARIANVFATLWDSPVECRRYFDDLLVDRRPGRKGFPPDVLADIFKLRRLHADRYPLI